MTDCTPLTGTTAPAQQASQILRAWMIQDRDTVRKELQNGLDLCQFPNMEGTLEGEQVELLRSVVDRLDQCAQGSNEAPLDPMVRICLGLLTHLAAQPPLALTESGIPKFYRC
jgi:hypothetical protein